MMGYELRYETESFANALRWDEGIHNTSEVRKRAAELSSSGHSLNCVWTARELRKDKYAIDHCFPWSRWNNNDLWNMMPANEKVNIQKSDKLPSAGLLHDARSRIQYWWQDAFVESHYKERFFYEAEASVTTAVGR